jgi:hypothetical protein
MIGVLYFVYTEMFVARAFCQWCTAVHGLVFSLFVISMLVWEPGSGYAGLRGTSSPRYAWADIFRRPWPYRWSRSTWPSAGVDKYGFPIRHRERKKVHHGFQTGDLVVADIPKGKYQGRWRGRVAVRKTGYFDIRDGTGKRIGQGISARYCRLLQRAKGWQYERESLPAGAGAAIPPHV